MIKMIKRGPKKDERSLLVLWRNNQHQKTFNEIISLAKKELGLERRTTINYLNSLCKANILEKSVDIERRTYYKPKNKMELDKAILIRLIEKCKDSELLSRLIAFFEAKG